MVERITLKRDPGVLQTVLDPALFRVISLLCSDAIAFSGNHTAVRQSVTRVLQELSRISEERFGHPSVEITALSQLLMRTHPDFEHRAVAERYRPDPLPLLWNNGKGEFRSDQHEAALAIREIWTAFYRFLVAGACDYSKQRAGETNVRPAPKGPADLMSTDVWMKYRSYCKWYDRAQHRFVTVEKIIVKDNEQVTVIQELPIKTVSVVFAVVCNMHHPTELDAAYRSRKIGWRRGTAMKTLFEELDLFAAFMEQNVAPEPAAGQ